MTEKFYSTDVDRPLQQGDVFLTSGLTRVALAGNVNTPRAWSSFSTHRSDFAPSLPGLPGLSSISGRAAVMVVSHDCHLDKDVHLRARELMREQGFDEQAAYESAEDDDSLDRHIVVCPIIHLDNLAAAHDKDVRGQIRSGRRVGYLPLPDNAALGLNGTVADLGYRATVDRLTLTQRLVSLTDDARLQLRYALARMDSLRTPDIGSELETAIGQRVVSIDRPKGKKLTLVLHLSDGSSLELLPRPGTTSQEGPRRQKAPTIADQ